MHDNFLPKRIIYYFTVLTLYGVLTWHILDITRASWIYWPWTGKNGFLILRQTVVELDHWRWAFQVHILTSSLVLITGLTQFARPIRQKHPKLHRFSGWLYVLITLILACPSGLIMAWYALGGFPARLAFLILGVAWAGFTIQAIITARQGHWKQHSAAMIRSYALALSAITLRLWKMWLFKAQSSWSWLTPEHIYQLQSWLGWMVNLMLAEILIRRR